MQSLRFTFHAGEDFRHIPSRLCRIDEAVEHLKFHAGDRIGHGIALGIAPQKWKNQNPVIIVPSRLRGSMCKATHMQMDIRPFPALDMDMLYHRLKRWRIIFRHMIC